MRFREVEKNIERTMEQNLLKKLAEEKEKAEGYGKIKPETNITVKEANDFINSLFAVG